MTKEQVTKFREDIWALSEVHTELTGDHPIECVLMGLAAAIRSEIDDTCPRAVSELIEVAAQKCESAAFDYYASFK